MNRFQRVVTTAALLLMAGAIAVPPWTCRVTTTDTGWGPIHYTLYRPVLAPPKDQRQQTKYYRVPGFAVKYLEDPVLVRRDYSIDYRRLVLEIVGIACVAGALLVATAGRKAKVEAK